MISRNIFSGSNTECGNYGNSLSRIFGKNFVKATVLLNMLLKSWFDEIFFWWERISRFSTLCAILIKGENLSYHILANVPSNLNLAFFSKHRIDRKPIYPGMRHRKCNINFQVLWTHPPNFVLLWGANMVETVLYGNSSSIWRASIVELHSTVWK